MATSAARVARPATAKGDTAALARDVVAGDRRALARAITLVESARAQDHERRAALLARLLPDSGGAVRLGISGPPGAGKSTFIEALGMHLIDSGRRVAVLAVDPSSRRSGGSILGDKTRMTELARHAHAFVRPSPSGGALGGVARRTREALLLCEAAGFDVVIVETVGVGQSETAVADMTDLFLLLLAPGGGDELQGLKRGIIERAELIVVNKTDGDLLGAARHVAAGYQAALTLLRPPSPHWTPKVLLCSALTGDGLAETWAAVSEHASALGESGEMAARRAEQAASWMWSEVTDTLIEQLRHDTRTRALVPDLERKVRAGAMTPGAAAEALVDSFRRQDEPGA